MIVYLLNQGNISQPKSILLVSFSENRRNGADHTKERNQRIREDF